MARSTRTIDAAQTEITNAIAAAHAEGWQAWNSPITILTSPDLISPLSHGPWAFHYLLGRISRARKRLTGPFFLGGPNFCPSVQRPPVTAGCDILSDPPGCRNACAATRDAPTNAFIHSAPVPGARRPCHPRPRRLGSAPCWPSACCAGGTSGLLTSNHRRHAGAACP